MCFDLLQLDFCVGSRQSTNIIRVTFDLFRSFGITQTSLRFFSFYLGEFKLRPIEFLIGANIVRQQNLAQVVLKSCVAGFLVEFVIENFMDEREQGDGRTHTQKLWCELLLDLADFREEVRVLVPQVAQPIQFSIN